MKKAETAKNIWFAVALMTAFAMVAAIPAIVFGAMDGKWVLFGLAVLFAVHGFYGSVFYWMAFGNARAAYRLMTAVTEENILTLAELSQHLSMEVKSTDRLIRDCVRKRYLTGWFYNGIELVKNQRQAPKEPEAEKEIFCEYCGSRLSPDESQCPYCGAQAPRTEE